MTIEVSRSTASQPSHPESLDQPLTADTPSLPPIAALRFAVHWPALWSSLPVAAMLLLALGAARASLPESVQPVIGHSFIEDRSFNGLLPSSETMIVTPVDANQRVLRGELRLAKSVSAQAPLRGQVSRVLVRPGQSVNVSDPILSLSTGITSRGTARAQAQQNSAEAAQVAAVNQQTSLQQRIDSAHARLNEAHLRVEAAQRRVTQARDIVARLQRGEEVAAPSAASRGPSAATLHQRAEQAARRAASTKQAAATAAAAAHQKQAKVTEARANVDKVQEQFEAGKAKGSDVEIARAALREAEVGAARATGAQQEAEQAAAQAEDDAADAARNEAKAGANKPRQITVAEAGRLVREAMDESDDAVREAERIKGEIDDYEHRVSTTKEKLDSTSENLERAQQVAVDAMIQAGLSTVRAPMSGVVLSVASPETRVEPGQPVVTVGQPNLWEIRIQDGTEAWKWLQPGAVLTAAVQTREPVDETTDMATPVLAPRPVAPPLYVTAVVKSIKAPKEPGQPAEIRASFDSSDQLRGVPHRRLRSGMQAVCVTGNLDAMPAVSVPNSALFAQPDGSVLVAVLDPMPATTPNPATTPCRIEFRQVTLGEASGLRQQILAGLQPGDRIALQPRALYAYAEAHGADAIIQLNNA